MPEMAKIFLGKTLSPLDRPDAENTAVKDKSQQISQFFTITSPWKPYFSLQFVICLVDRKKMLANITPENIF
jgi:hypothetical protein